ncbi:hypothetical protein Dimus_000095, partial [Dionaea muscipula]
GGSLVPVEGVAMFQVFEKLKEVKHRLKALHHRAFLNLDSRIENTRRLILEAQENLQLQYTDDNRKILDGFINHHAESSKVKTSCIVKDLKGIG